MPHTEINNLYILTKHAIDVIKNGELQANYVFWAISDNQVIQLIFENQQPVIFIQRDQALPASMSQIVFQRKHLALKVLEASEETQYIDGCYFKSLKNYYQFKHEAGLNSIRLFESDVSPQERFLMERFIFGACIIDAGNRQVKKHHTICKNPIIKSSKFRPKLTYLSLDIETNFNGKEIYSIGLYNEQNKCVFVVGNGNNSTKEIVGESYHVFYCRNEMEMLIKFIQHLNEVNPDLIIGWNVINFDLTVLEKKCKHYHVPFNLGRSESVSKLLSAEPQRGSMARILIDGRIVIDGIDTLRSAFYNFKSFALNNVAHELLGEEKHIDKAQDSIVEIQRLFEEDKPKLAEYNIQDCRLVAKIFEKTMLFDFIIDKATITGLSIGRLGGSVAAFDYTYLPKLHRKGYVGLDIGDAKYEVSSPGGYVLNSTPGFFDNVLLLDFKSLYPSIIRTFLIDPLGFRESFLFEDSTDLFVEGYDGGMFSKNTHILPEIVTKLSALRDQAKIDKNSPLSQAIKIIMNSFYGVLGTPKCRFFHPSLVSSITKRGHEIILKTKAFIESKGWSVIYGDTDSLFVHIGNNHTYLESAKHGEELVNEINQWWEHELQKRYGIESYLEIENETLFAKYFMPTVRGSYHGSKKRYAGWVLEQGSTDISDGKLYIKGLESVRTDWVDLAKKLQVELLRRIFLGQEYKSYLVKQVRDMRDGLLDHELIFSKRIRKPLEEYQKNVPPHIQAAKKSNKSYQSGSKIQYVQTLEGPQVYDIQIDGKSGNSALDYNYYLEHQVNPAIEALLQCAGDNAEQITSQQASLF